MFVPKTTAAVFFVLLVVNIGVCLFLQQQELSLNIQAQRGLLSLRVRGRFDFFGYVIVILVINPRDYSL